MRKVLIFLIIAFLFFGIILIAAQNEGPLITKPADIGIQPPSTGTSSTTSEEKITAGENEVKKVGDKVGELKPDAVTIQGGTLTPGAENSKFNFETKNSELISSGNKINNVESQTSETKAEVKLNKKGGIDEADVKAGKEGTNIQAGGKKSNLEFNAPEGSRVIKNKENNIFQVELKEGSQINQEPVKKQKKEGESEEEDKTVQYNSRTGFTKLPDDVAKSLGFKSMEFKGILSHNGDNWFVGKNHETTFKIDGKESLLMKNIYGQVKNVNENLNVYFKQGKFEGNYVHFGKGLEIGSSNNLDGNAVQFLKGNPYLNIGDNGHFAVQSLANSKIIAENGKVSVRGGTIVDQDYTSYLLSEKKSQLLFKEGIGIKGFSENDIKNKVTAPLEFLPFKSDGTPISPYSQKILFDNNKGVKFLQMNQNELDVGRVMINQPAVDSENRPIAPLVPVQPVPVQPVQPIPSPQPVPQPIPVSDSSKIKTGTINPTQNTGQSGVLGDVMNHKVDNAPIYQTGPDGTPRRVTDNDLDEITRTHENVHGINNYLSNEFSKKYGGRYQGIYILDNKFVLLKEPGFDKYQIADYIPRSLKSGRFNNYVVNGQQMPEGAFYVLNELSAYTSGGMAAIEAYNRNPRISGSDAVSGTLDFSVMALGVGNAVKEKNPSYWNSADGEQFRNYLKFELERSMGTFNQGIKIPQYSNGFPEQHQLYNNLRKSADAEQLRQFTRETFGAEWAREVFGF